MVLPAVEQAVVLVDLAASPAVVVPEAGPVVSRVVAVPEAGPVPLLAVAAPLASQAALLVADLVASRVAAAPEAAG